MLLMHIIALHLSDELRRFFGIDMNYNYTALLETVSFGWCLFCNRLDFSF